MAVAQTVSRLALTCLLLAGAAGTAAGDRQLEYELKAQFLAYFMDFLDWPAEAFGSPKAPFRLCLIGGDPFGATLRDRLASGRVDGRRIEIETLKDEPRAAACQMIFAGDISPARAEALHKATRGRQVLLVSDSPDLLRHCADIAFAVEGATVRFDVNLPALASHGLQVNPRLLRVARDATDRFSHCR